jgi:hypothetical protein
MTDDPNDEAHFISLWQQGLETAAIVQRLGISVGTVHSRSASFLTGPTTRSRSPP